MSFKNYQQLKQAYQLLEKVKHSRRVEQGIQNFSLKRQQMRLVAQNQMKLIRESPESKHYNLISCLMIGFGGVGLTLMLKYQDQFAKILPDWMLIEQPYPENEEKINIGKQSQYYYSQSLYFQALSGWSIIFLKRSRMISPLTYMMAWISFLVGTYLVDYYNRPNLKHSLWFLYNITFGAMLGSYFYQQGFKVLVDALYLIGNSMTMYAASTYYGPKENPGILLTAMGCTVFGLFYGLGVLRLFRWGLQLNDKKLYPISIGALSILLSWSIYRSLGVQDEYTAQNFNPINASLSYFWKQIPQVNVFVDAFYHNKQKSKRIPSSQQQEVIQVEITNLNNNPVQENVKNEVQEQQQYIWQPLGTSGLGLFQQMLKAEQQKQTCQNIMSSQQSLLQLMRGETGNQRNSKVEIQMEEQLQIQNKESQSKKSKGKSNENKSKLSVQSKVFQIDQI
eukprot:403373579